MVEENVDATKDDAAESAAPSGEGQISEKEIDETLMGSFPASDPPSWTLGTDHHAETESEERPGTSQDKLPREGKGD